MRLLRALVPFAACAVAVGCGLGDDDAEGSTTRADCPLGGEFSIEGGLEALPSLEGDEVTVTVADLLAAAEANGAGPRPDDADDHGSWLLRATGITGDDDGPPPPVHVPTGNVAGWRATSPADEVEDELGWSLRDVDRLAEAGAPPSHVTVVAGDVDAGTLEGADLEDLGDGVWSAGDGEDGEVDPDAAGPARPIGAPLRMAARDGCLAASSSTAAVEGWVADEAAALPRSEQLRAIARALDDGAAVAALLVVADFAFPSTPGAVAPDARPITTPFEAAGIGWSSDDGEPAVTVAYAFADEAAAEATTEEVSSAWTDGDSLRTGRPLGDLAEVAEVRAVDALVVVRLTIPDDSRSQVVADMLFGRDLPFVHR